MPFHAEAAELQSFVNEMNEKHEAIAKMISTSSSHAHSLQGPAFEGAAGKAFQATFDHFLTAANKMNDALLRNADNLKSAGAKYSELEQDNLGQLQSVANNVDSGSPVLKMT